MLRRIDQFVKMEAQLNAIWPLKAVAVDACCFFL
jgi:hypothetical protein